MLFKDKKEKKEEKYKGNSTTIPFFKEEKQRKDIHQSSLVLLDHKSVSELPPLFDLLSSSQENINNAWNEANVYLSYNQFLEGCGIGKALSSGKNASLSLAIVPHKLLMLNGATLVYVDHLSPEQIIFSIMGDKGVPFGKLLEQGHLRVNPDYADFIKHLTKSSPQPAKAIIDEFMPSTVEVGEVTDNQDACQKFISNLGEFDAQTQYGLLEVLSLPLNPAAQTKLSDVKQFRQDREHRHEINHQLKWASNPKLPDSEITTIPGYVGSKIPGLSTPLDSGDETESPEMGHEESESYRP